MLKTVLAVVLLSAFLPGCTSTGPGPQQEGTASALTYRAGNEVFTLTKACINDVALSEDGNALFFDIKNSTDCSRGFAHFFRRHVGEDVDVRFHNVTVADKLKIVSPLTFTQGFYQQVTDPTAVGNILKYYKKQQQRILLP